MSEDEVYRMLNEAAANRSAPTQEEHPTPSREIMKRAEEPTFLGDIAGADGHALEAGECGDAMEVYLSVHDRVIRKARFDTLGCGYTVACGDLIMELAENRTLAEALAIRPQQVDEALGGLPDSHKHCAELAVRALRRAVQNAMERSRDPWKKHYG